MMGMMCSWANAKNKERPDGNKTAKDKIRKQAKAHGLRDKIDEMMKSKENLVKQDFGD
jgi:hypothetical protein